jgi:hypothetical protein
MQVAAAVDRVLIAMLREMTKVPRNAFRISNFENFTPLELSAVAGGDLPPKCGTWNTPPCPMRSFHQGRESFLLADLRVDKSRVARQVDRFLASKLARMGRRIRKGPAPTGKLDEYVQELAAVTLGSHDHRPSPCCPV